MTRSVIAVTSAAEKRALLPGDYAKLIFSEQDGSNGERMWAIGAIRAPGLRRHTQFSRPQKCDS